MLNIVELRNVNPPELVDAVRVWTGWGQSIAPNRDDARLARRFGADVAAEFLPVIKALEESFYSSDARLVADNLQHMEKLASEQFRQTHPTVPDEVVEVLAWCYTFDFK